MPDVETQPILELCYYPLSWKAAREAIKAIPEGKTLGIDKIPGEILKLVQDKEEPASQMTKALCGNNQKHFERK